MVVHEWPTAADETSSNDLGEGRDGERPPLLA
jgi:hypothetical protein